MFYILLEVKIHFTNGLGKHCKFFSNVRRNALSFIPDFNNFSLFSLLSSERLVNFIDSFKRTISFIGFLD